VSKKEPKQMLNVILHVKDRKKLHFRDEETEVIWQRRLRKKETCREEQIQKKCGIVETKGGESCGNKDVFDSVECCKKDK
jgi:hypothetical protein